MPASFRKGSGSVIPETLVRVPRRVGATLAPREMERAVVVILGIAMVVPINRQVGLVTTANKRGTRSGTVLSLKKGSNLHNNINLTLLGPA
jgi:hypothetical protein